MNTRFLRTTSTGFFIVLLSVSACAEEQGTTEMSDAASETEADAAMAQEAAPPARKLNLNTATGDAFRTIPDVGDRMVHEFEEYRPYVSIRQFRREIGKYVDADQVAAYEQYVFVPIDPNASDAATLQQLPGVDADEAQALIDGRPYDSNEAFLEQLATHVSEEELEQASAYLVTE